MPQPTPLNLKNHIARKSQALKAHNRQLDSDVQARLGGAPHPGHSTSRHGYQSGWQAQIMRACTQYAPDQASSPDGVSPTITEWDREVGTWAQVRAFLTSYSPIKLPYIDPPTVKTYDSNGQPITRTTSQQDAGPIQPAPDAVVGGTDAGGFISPEAQQEALQRANSIAWKHWQWTDAKFQTGGGVWRPYSRIAMVLGGRPGGYGLGFERTNSFASQNWDRSGVERAITAFEERWTWQQWDPGLHVSQQHLANKIRFDEMDDLCHYFGLRAVWQKHAKVILDKHGTAYGKWTLVTAYPVNEATGWAPSGPAGGSRHKSTGPIWTGEVRGTKAGVQVNGNYPVPAW